MRVYLRPRRLKAEEVQGPPAERERLQCNETFMYNLTKKLQTNSSIIGFFCS
ncbi:hypothetical protein [Peribacillus muralis]|uniref:hypothetical protein n=1 Tax=Peribacillus muralis TaxID=264697 RepID=UPI00366B2271